MRPRAIALALAFPALAWGYWAGLPPRALASALAALALFQAGPWLGRRGAVLAGLVLAGVAGLSLWRPVWALRAYPIAVNLGLLAVFASSLRQGPSVIERLATLRSGPLGPEAVRYTRAVTRAWCLFFPLNAAASLLSAFAFGGRYWALYNGFLAYMGMGLMFSGEWLVRRRVLASASTPPAPAGPAGRV